MGPSGKKIKFGTIDPNIGGWDQLFPNFYKSLFIAYLTINLG